MVLSFRVYKAPKPVLFILQLGPAWGRNNTTIQGIDPMTVYRGVKTRGARAAVFFLWIILIFSHLRLHFSVHEETSTATTDNKSLSTSPTPSRKARFFNTASFHAPSTSPHDQFTGIEDDKRIVHTGPNPLHN